jgi:hypothetical protein
LGHAPARSSRWRTLQRRVLRPFQRRGLLHEDTVESMLTWQASGGFSLDASVRPRQEVRRSVFVRIGCSWAASGAEAARR